jgi:superfamily II DNA helicase RecQ
MPIRLFQYALPVDPELADLNEFLATHRVAGVHRETVTTSMGPMLLFVVQWTHDGRDREQTLSGRERIDYREILDPSQFELFSRLRDVRKQLALADGIPVYKVFSNAQLAEMVQKKMHDRAAIAQIPGIGKSRVDKYVAAILPVLQEVLGGPSAGSSRDDAAQ